VDESQLFAAALRLSSPAERAAYLDGACAGDARLRAGVEALLRAHATDPDFLERPAAWLGGTTAAGGVEQAGVVLAGRYKLLESIGEGGMGTVWMARQTEPVRRPVAVKLIKAGLGSKAVLARFEAERQALALMDHPHIARVLDAGVAPDGRPYFVMELVRGVPITRFCDEHRLTPRERLGLFVDVCQAVQHAHQKGVIHRDLKPSNVLVARCDDRPVPKVIDFGVAKATGRPLTEETLQTALGAVVGTVEYMSPEQANFNTTDVDTRSDVYSLGVLLYELLTGGPPFTRVELEKAGVVEMLRRIREREPPRPSTRLSTAEGLPALAATRGTEPRRLVALVRGELDWLVMRALEKDRNRRYESASAFAADVRRYLNDEPVLACPPSAWYRFRKFARRKKAALATAALVLFSLVLVGGGAGWVARDHSARQLAVGEVVTHLLRQADDSQQQGDWPGALAAAQRAEAALTGTGADAALDRRVRERLAGLVLVRRLDAIRLRRSESPDFHSGMEAADRDYATAFREYGIDVDRLSPAEAAEAIRSRPAVTAALAVALDDWAYVRRGRANLAGAVALTEAASAADPDPFRRRLREAVRQNNWPALGPLAASDDLPRQPPTTLILLGLYLRKVGTRPGLEVLRRAQHEYPGDFWINYTLGSVLFAEGGREERAAAIAYLRAAAALRPQACGQLAEALHADGQWDEAIACYRQALEHQPNEAWPHAGIGHALRRKGVFNEAIASYRRALARDPDLAQACAGLAWLLATCPDPRLRDPAQAVRLADRAVALAPQGWSGHAALGAAHYRCGEWQAAAAVLEKARGLHQGGNSPVWFFLAMADWQQGRKEEARTAYDQAVAWMERNQPANEELHRLRTEAAALLTVGGPPTQPR
jgi:tetratricopeptide (TPR) repeat protein